MAENRKRNISNVKDCYGCGMCAAVCPVKIIGMRDAGTGFYQPEICDEERCIDCGLCLDTCAFVHRDELEFPPVKGSWAARSRSEEVLRRCSSGGIAHEAARLLMERGYKVCQARYNPQTQQVEHYISTKPEELDAGCGSKYVQSYTPEAFSRLKANEGPWMVVGTPCQIASLRRHLRRTKTEDKFVLIDFFCHGVPSRNVLKKYLAEAGNPQPAKLTWRDKTRGWQHSWAMTVDGHRCENEEGDEFYRWFFSNLCLNHCCYDDCRFKCYSSAADLRVGDLWGKTYAHDRRGTSGVLAFTERGMALMRDLQTSCEMEEAAPATVVEGQMKRPLHRPRVWRKLIAALGTDASLAEVWQRVVVPYRRTLIVKRAWRRILKMLKR